MPAGFEARLTDDADGLFVAAAADAAHHLGALHAAILIDDELNDDAAFDTGALG